MKNSEKGITLVEIIITILIIALFTMITIANFPAIQKQYALSSATYKLAQDLRKTQDLGLSGVTLYDSAKKSIAVKGYGLYVNPTKSEYIIYADVATTSNTSGSQNFDNTNFIKCDEYDVSSDTGDCIIDTINIIQQNQNLTINGITNISSPDVSINFTPPGPVTTISNLNSGSNSVDIILSNGVSSRKISVNTSGLINVAQ